MNHLAFPYNNNKKDVGEGAEGDLHIFALNVHKLWLAQTT